MITFLAVYLQKYGKSQLKSGGDTEKRPDKPCSGAPTLFCQGDYSTGILRGPAWLFTHLLFLVSSRNPLFGMSEWARSYLTYIAAQN